MNRNNEDQTSSRKQRKHIKTFPVTTSINSLEVKENIINIINPSYDIKLSKEKIINKAIEFHEKGDVLEAERYYKYCINQSFNDDKVFANYAAILKSQGKLKEAESLLLKAISLNPECGINYYNLANILRKLRKFDQAILYIEKAKELSFNQNLCLSVIGNILLEKDNYSEGSSKLKEGEGSIQFDLRCGITFS